MNTAFSICSNNYLAHAKTVGDSFLKYHPEFKFAIILVDKFSDDLDPSFFGDLEIIPVEELPIKEFDELKAKYNITELNTSVKPSCFHYLFKKFNSDKIIYLDPDILVTSRFEEALDILDTKNIIITPHLTTPVDDGHWPSDHHTLAGGVFNLGFMGLSNYEIVNGFLNWWHQRVVKYGFMDYARAMFYDQLWINYVPVLYDNYCIVKHPGYNMANWNLHERTLTMDEHRNFIVNKNFPLRFFHFSSYNYQKPDIICEYQDRFDFNRRQDLLPLFEKYNMLLKKNKVEIISKLKVYYYPHINSDQHYVKSDPFIKRIFSRFKRATNILFTGNE